MCRLKRAMSLSAQPARQARLTIGLLVGFRFQVFDGAQPCSPNRWISGAISTFSILSCQLTYFVTSGICDGPI